MYFLVRRRSRTSFSTLKENGMEWNALFLTVSYLQKTYDKLFSFLLLLSKETRFEAKVTSMVNSTPENFAVFHPKMSAVSKNPS